MFYVIAGAVIAGLMLKMIGTMRAYKGSGLNPIIYPEKAKTDACKFAPGTYVAGTVVGQLNSLTAANDVQTITVSGTPTGGSFTLQFMGSITGNIAFNATATNVRDALIALPTIGTGNVSCSGGPFPGTPVVVTFQGALAGQLEPLITLYTNSLTGGAAPNVAVAHTTPGNSAGGSWLAYNNGASDGSDIAKGVLKYDLSVDSFGNHTSGGGEWGGMELSAPVYIAGYFRTADLTGLDAAGITDLGRIVRGSVAQIANIGTILEIY